MGRPQLAVLSVAWALVLAAAGPPREVRAEAPRPIALHWTRAVGATECVSGAALAAQVEERLGHPVFPGPAAAELAIEALVEPVESGGFRAQLRLRDAGGQELGARELKSAAKDCRELSQAAVLVVAIMVDPDAGMLDAPAATADTPEPVPQQNDSEALPALTAAARTEPTEQTEQAPATRALGALVRVNTHTLPLPSPGFGAEFQQQLPHGIGLRVEALAFIEQERTLADPQDGGVSLQMMTMGIGACPPIFARGPFGAALCARLHGGVLLHRSQNLAEPSDGVLPLVGASIGTRLWVESRRLRFVVGAAASAPFVRHQLDVFLADGERRVLYEQGALTAEIDLGLAARF